MMSASLLLVLVLAAFGQSCAAAPQRPGAPPAVSGPAAPRASASLSGAVALPATLVVSVLPFEDRTRTPALAWLRKGLADMLVAELAHNPSLLVVQRDRLEEVIREQALQLSGRVADESMVRIGRLAGATVLITGSVSAAGGGVRLDAQLLGVENGAVLGTAVAEGPEAEVAETAREFVERVAGLLPGAGDRRMVTVVERHSGLVPAAQANEAGEALTREGKLFEALEAYERALAAHPGYQPARSNYARVVRELPGTDLVRAGEAADVRVVERLIERLTGSGLDAELGPARSARAPDGTMMVRIPVRLKLARSAVEAVTAAARAMGGSVGPAPGVPGALEFVLSADSEKNRAFTRALATPRRIYLRLQGAAGRTLAVYSRLRGWLVSGWVAPLDDRRVRIEPERLVDTEAAISGLTSEQVVGLARASVTVVPVPRERATVHLDTADGGAVTPHGALAAGQARTSGRRDVGMEEAEAREIEALRSLLEQAWDPPITERPWGRGYLPGNERVVVITMLLDLACRSVAEAPRPVGTSGDPEFDVAALAAVGAALERWRAASTTCAEPDAEPRTIRVRAQVRLLKDVPGLNLIGPLEQPAARTGPGP
ncbi:CsgG/HfaB family protein [Nitrospira sp. Kam-Ns4a]